MAEITIVPADVLPSASAQIQQGIAEVAIVQGQTLYVDTASQNELALATASGAAPANVLAGIALNAAAPGQIINYVSRDPALIIGSILTAGEDLWLSPTAGGITATVADVVSGDLKVYVGNVNLGGAANVATINFNPVQGGVMP